MKATIWFLVLIFICNCVQAQRNVILIIADDLGTDYCGFYEDHGDTANLPHLNSLLDDGIRFQNAMSNPVCSATRAGILTGRYSFRTGVGYIVGSTSGSGQLDVNEKTIPELLKVYNPQIATGLVGKWHLHNPTPPANLQNPNLMGFEHFEGPFIGAIPDYYNWLKYTNGVASNITNCATSENVNNAVDWIKNQNGNPFFLWLAFNAPHSPYHLPPAGMYSDTTLTGTPQHINANPKKYFKASLEALDYEIGRLFDSLQAINQLDSTDFIFVGDNGNSIQTAQTANPFRAKGTNYQYGVHVPLIISGPSVVDGGRVSDALVNTQDLFSTILELYGDTLWPSQIPVNKPVDSESLLPIIKNQSSQIRSWSFTENFKTIPDSTDGKAMRNMEYKLLHFDADGHQEFYHLSADSLELNNLLNGTLTQAELINYNYLCNEMSNLTGVGTFCNASSAVHEQEGLLNEIHVDPNPFTSFLNVDENHERNYFQLVNAIGQIIYEGNQIETINFSKLGKGIYFLKSRGNSATALKLMKN